ncbi:hypothetical protein C8Q75DRAFT_751872 [Abortiporus biennis]|nr:hypothetical protein C8Q75DRAFT_751872 [Abortiporus biennis]
MDDNVKKYLDDLRSLVKRNKDKKLRAELLQVLENLQSFHVLLKTSSTTPSNSDKLQKHFRKPLLSLYAAYPPPSLQLAAVLARQLYDEKILAELTAGRADKVSQWEAVLKSLLLGILDFLDEHNDRHTKEIIGSTVYDALCSFAFSLSIPNTSSRLRTTLYDLLSESARSNKVNQERLRDPIYMGSQKLGLQIWLSKDYLVLESLLNLFARLLPPSHHKTKRAAFMRAVFVEAYEENTKVGQQIVKVIQEFRSTDWDHIAVKVVEVLAASSISFPQPFAPSGVSACGRPFVTDRLFADEKGFYANVPIEDDQYETLEVPYKTIYRIETTLFHTKVKEQEKHMARVSVTLTAPPILGVDPVVGGAAPGSQSPTLIFSLDHKDLPRLKEALKARGLEKHFRHPIKNPRQSLAKSPTLLEIDSAGKLVSKEERYENVSQLYEMNDMSDDVPQDTAMDAGQPESIATGQSSKHEHPPTPPATSPIKATIQVVPISAEDSAIHRTPSLKSSPIDEDSPLKSTKALVPERSGTSVIRKKVFGASDEELSDFTEDDQPLTCVPSKAIARAQSLFKTTRTTTVDSRTVLSKDAPNPPRTSRGRLKGRTQIVESEAEVEEEHVPVHALVKKKKKAIIIEDEDEDEEDEIENSSPPQPIVVSGEDSEVLTDPVYDPSPTRRMTRQSARSASSAIPVQKKTNKSSNFNPDPEPPAVKTDSAGSKSVSADRRQTGASASNIAKDPSGPAISFDAARPARNQPSVISVQHPSIIPASDLISLDPLLPGSHSADDDDDNEPELARTPSPPPNRSVTLPKARTPQKPKQNRPVEDHDDRFSDVFSSSPTMPVIRPEHKSVKDSLKRKGQVGSIATADLKSGLPAKRTEKKESEPAAHVSTSKKKRKYLNDTEKDNEDKDKVEETRPSKRARGAIEDEVTLSKKNDELRVTKTSRPAERYRASKKKKGKIDANVSSPTPVSAPPPVSVFPASNIDYDEIPGDSASVVPTSTTKSKSSPVVVKMKKGNQDEELKSKKTKANLKKEKEVEKKVEPSERKKKDKTDLKQHEKSAIEVVASSGKDEASIVRTKKTRETTIAVEDAKAKQITRKKAQFEDEDMDIGGDTIVMEVDDEPPIEIVKKERSTKTSPVVEGQTIPEESKTRAPSSKSKNNVLVDLTEKIDNVDDNRPLFIETIDDTPVVQIDHDEPSVEPVEVVVPPKQLKKSNKVPWRNLHSCKIPEVTLARQPEPESEPEPTVTLVRRQPSPQQDMPQLDAPHTSDDPDKTVVDVEPEVSPVVKEKEIEVVPVQDTIMIDLTVDSPPKAKPTFEWDRSSRMAQDTAPEIIEKSGFDLLQVPSTRPKLVSFAPSNKKTPTPRTAAKHSPRIDEIIHRQIPLSKPEFKKPALPKKVQQIPKPKTPDFEDFANILNEINEVIIAKMSGKFNAVRRDIQIAQEQLLADAASDLSSMREDSIEHFNTLIGVEAEYGTFGRNLTNALEDVVKSHEDVCLKMRKVVEIHDRGSLEKNAPKSLFSKGLPSSLSKFQK